MQSDKIRAFEQHLKGDFLNSHALGFFFAEIGIIGKDLHFQTARTVTHNATDIARTDYAKRFARQFHPHKAGFFPFARMGGCAGLGDLP